MFSCILYRLTLFLRGVNILHNCALVVCGRIDCFFVLLFVVVFFTTSRVGIRRAGTLYGRASTCNSSFPRRRELVFCFVY